MASRRADAMRNRAAVLEATAELVERSGATELRMAEVAERAGVGAGTIYRSFGDRSGLLLALIDAEERDLQEDLIRGEPPLGPGAPAGERLEAFVSALHEMTVRRRDVLSAADASSAQAARCTGAYQAWRLHLRNLLAELQPDADAEVLAELLLATIAAPLQVHLIDDRGNAPENVRAELLRLTRGLADPAPRA